ncbi:uncharacterized protein F5Z01DRAFT_676291 [Emericellopsis atlantica]|uniref:FHA domain-containing protein n=1 Tax=Emericellopsis atlantica TaxID=2614577 RepID=A0A9P8CNS9_9HYPO|nr:uncharacterized protein F5Z01DRAFT_676291 [Emericellopsis atlantica]KAG9252046.1 hypothetical protein F5Z01DRAFT_676291 [Emericellopsis atlantica]
MRPERAFDSPRPIDLTEPSAHQPSQPQEITATVKLTSTNAEDRLGPLGCRRLVLTPAKPTCPIGRASSKRSGLEANATNAYFESAVVSRCHAELQLDVQCRQVILKDKGSLHGTLHNDRRLKAKETRTLKSGDTITLGAQIERGHDRFQPYKVHTNIVWEIPDHTNRPVTYTVPDDTDVEDHEDDCGDETDLAFAQSVLVENGFNPPSSPIRIAAASALQSYSGAVVDLTAGQVAAAVQKVHKATEPTSIDLEEPDLYSDDRVHVGALPAETLWHSTVGDESSEDMPGSSMAEEWGPRTSSGSGNEFADVSAYESELDNDVETHDLDDEQPLEENFMDSDAASLMDDFEPDEAANALPEDDSEWTDYGSLTAGMNDTAGESSLLAQAPILDSKPIFNLQDIVFKPLPRNTLDANPHEQVSSTFGDLSLQTHGPSTASVGNDYAPVSPSLSDNHATTSGHESSFSRPLQTSAVDEKALYRKAKGTVLAMRASYQPPRGSMALSDSERALVENFTAQVKAKEAKQTTTADDEVAQEAPPRDTETTGEDMSAGAQHQTAPPETPSRKRGADKISRSTVEEDEATAKTAEAAVQAGDVSKEPTTLVAESSQAISQTEPANESNPVVQAGSPTKEQRPTKRVRRSVAEAAGYVALGGVLAWSALVATAPVL